MLLGYSGDICRFPSAGHYASYNGTAPIELSSGGRTVHRLSRRGNRTLNHAIHMIAVTQARGIGPGRAYIDKQTGRGKDRVAALRLLRRRLSDVVYAGLKADDRAIELDERVDHRAALPIAA